MHADRDTPVAIGKPGDFLIHRMEEEAAWLVSVGGQSLATVILKEEAVVSNFFTYWF